MSADVVLGADELVPGRSFTDPDHARRDGEVMLDMLARQRAVARGWSESEVRRAQHTAERDAQGRMHWLTVPDPAALLQADGLTAVGFFGQARADTDHAILFELEEEVVAGLGAYVEVGLLSHYDMELGRGRYGNLILFSTPDVPEKWYLDSAHGRAIRLAPRHFHSVRLNKGSIPGPLLGDGDLTIERTKYVDFEQDAAWHAVRMFSQPTV